MTRLRVLDARLLRFEQQGELPAMADVEVLTWMVSRLAASITPDDDGRRTAGGPIAGRCRTSTQARLDEVTGQRIERVIVGPRQLKAAVKPASPASPDVTEAMYKGGATVGEAMQLQVNQWIGTTQTAGLLNKPPYNLPAGLGIQRTEPATGQPTTVTAPGP
jgi:hypothetical protein